MVAASIDDETRPLDRCDVWRPLAAQLAVTAARNVRKGRKPAGRAKRSGILTGKTKATARRTASVIKAKPVLIVAQKKRAPKRRHVWLGTQVRVIRPVTLNVVSIQSGGRTLRPVARPAAQKTTGRQLRLAA